MNPSEAAQRVRSADEVLNASDPTPFPVPARGLESVIAGALTALKPSHWWVPGIRERVGAVLRDVPVERLTDAFAGAKPYKVAPPSPSPANRALYAVGLAVASGPTLVHLGVGSLADGSLFEALNAAKLQAAPVVFVVAVHALDEGAPLGQQLAVEPAQLGASLGIPTQTLSGQDAGAVHAAVQAALDASGPHLIIANL